MPARVHPAACIGGAWRVSGVRSRHKRQRTAKPARRCVARVRQVRVKRHVTFAGRCCLQAMSGATKVSRVCPCAAFAQPRSSAGSARHERCSYAARVPLAYGHPASALRTPACRSKPKSYAARLRRRSRSVRGLPRAPSRTGAVVHAAQLPPMSAAPPPPHATMVVRSPLQWSVAGGQTQRPCCSIRQGVAWHARERKRDA